MIRIDIQPRLRFHQSDGNSLDPQGLELLQAVHDTGKLTEAAARVGYSYRHAWNLLGKWQAFFGSPLIELERGRGALFLKTAQPVACAMCHGEQGDGRGFMGAALVPPPRNFTCGSMMKNLPDGQLFWIIKNGSPGTGMMSFAAMPDEQVWQIIHYIRSLAK